MGFFILELEIKEAGELIKPGRKERGNTFCILFAQTMKREE